MNLLYRYDTWLIIVSLAVLALERIRPWRKDQPFIRPQLGQDVFWFLFNGFALGMLLAVPLDPVFKGIDALFARVTGIVPSGLRIAAAWPLWVQIPVFLVVADFLEWSIHYTLHRNGFLWKFHRLHHSIKHMDWIGNFRFHWGEVIWYKLCKYLPLALLGASWQAMLAVAVVSTFIGNLNHANIGISWGPLRYVFNSPRMHLWHHEKALRGRAGTNFAVVLSLWDWLFGTAYFPQDGSVPAEIGFGGEETYPQNALRRFFTPLA